MYVYLNMDLQSEKIELAKQLLETESWEVINQIKAVFKREEYDFYDDLPEHVKEGIERGLKDIEEGRTHDHDTVMAEVKAKYGITD